MAPQVYRLNVLGRRRFVGFAFGGFPIVFGLSLKFLGARSIHVSDCGGLLDRIEADAGTRRDVEISRDFTKDLMRTTLRLLAEKPFPAFLRDRRADLSRTTWFLHDDYETDRIEACYAQLIDRWAPILSGAQRSLRNHCRAMIVAAAIQLPPAGAPNL